MLWRGHLCRFPSDADARKGEEIAVAETAVLAQGV